MSKEYFGPYYCPTCTKIGKRGVLFLTSLPGVELSSIRVGTLLIIQIELFYNFHPIKPTLTFFTFTANENLYHTYLHNENTAIDNATAAAAPPTTTTRRAKEKARYWKNATP